MKVFDLFVSKYPPDQELRKPTIEMLEQFQGKLPTELLNLLTMQVQRMHGRRPMKQILMRLN